MTRSRPRLAVVTTHPVQYHAPVFRRLAERGRVDVRVFYEWEGASQTSAFDPGFGLRILWDVPLLGGYAHEFVPNVARDPGTHHFGGIDNPDLLRRVTAWRPDAVLLFGWSSRTHLRVLRRLRGRVPLLFRGDSTLLDETPGVRQRLRRVWLRWVYRHIDVALDVGIHNRAYFRAHGVQGHRLVRAPHAVDNARFEDPTGQHEADAQAWRARLGIRADAVVFLFAGKLEAKKAPEVLLDAFAGLGPTPSHLVFAGSGPLEGALRARSVPNVHFVGFQNQSRMPTVYRLGDVLVLPSRGPGETWGLAVNEAMAAGRPAVVSDRVGCAPDLVLDGLTGLVVPAGDVPALRDALAALADDRARCARMGAAAAGHIAGWTVDTLADSIEVAVGKLSENRPTEHAAGATLPG